MCIRDSLGIAAAANRLFGQGGAAFGITLLTLAYGGEQSITAFASALLVGTALSSFSVVAALGIGARRLDLHSDEAARSVPAAGR